MTVPGQAGEAAEGRGRYGILALFVALVLGGGLAIGYATAPGPWYSGLATAPFNPPNWVFAPTWSILYVAIAVAGWRLWRRARGSAAMALWWAQLALNFAWAPVFFGLHRAGAAFAIILTLLAVILLLVASAWRRDRPAAALLVPYAAWVAFASALNGWIAAAN